MIFYAFSSFKIKEIYVTCMILLVLCNKIIQSLFNPCNPCGSHYGVWGARISYSASPTALIIIPEGHSPWGMLTLFDGVCNPYSPSDSLTKRIPRDRQLVCQRFVVVVFLVRGSLSTGKSCYGDSLIDRQKAFQLHVRVFKNILLLSCIFAGSALTIIIIIIMGKICV